MIRYEIIIYWSEEDQAFVAEVPELPGCMADGATYQETIVNAESVIQEWIKTARELGRPIPEAKVVLTPAGVNFRISPAVVGGTSATKRLPPLSNASPRGLLVNPVAKTVFVASGANLRISPLPELSAVEAKRLPELSNIRPMGDWAPLKLAGPAKTVRTPPGVNL